MHTAHRQADRQIDRPYVPCTRHMTGHMYLWISVRRNYSDGWLRERDCEAARSGTSDERGYGYPNHRLCLPWTHSDWLRRYVSICNDWVVQWIVCFAYQKLHHPKNETKQPGAFHHDTWHYIIVIHHHVVKWCKMDVCRWHGCWHRRIPIM